MLPILLNRYYANLLTYKLITILITPNNNKSIIHNNRNNIAISFITMHHPVKSVKYLLRWRNEVYYIFHYLKSSLMPSEVDR